MDKYKEFPYTNQTVEYLLDRSKVYHRQISFDYLKEIQNGRITPDNREHLIHWVSEICSEKGFSQKTVQLTISYIDLFLSKKAIPDCTFLKLITYICLSLALKYEEMRHLSCQEIYILCQQKFSIEVIETTQIYILGLFDWVLEIPEPNEILSYLMLATCEDFNWESIRKSVEQFVLVARSDYDLSRNSPVAIAIASALCVFDKWKLKTFSCEWLRTVTEKYEFNSNSLVDLANGIWNKVSSYQN